MKKATPKIVFTAIVAFAFAQDAQALSNAARDFLLSISIDPSSDDVTLADQDGTIRTIVSGDPEENSLESLAIAKKKNGVKCFIEARTYMRRLKADSSRSEKIVAGHPLYSCAYQIYLTPEERELGNLREQ